MPTLTRTSTRLSLGLVVGLVIGLVVGLVVGLGLSGCAAKGSRPPEGPTLVHVDADAEVELEGEGASVEPRAERPEASTEGAEGDGVGDGMDELAMADTDEAGQAGQAGQAVQEITFDGEDADPGLATEIRSAPKRPTLPSFRLFGTRAGDGP